MNFVAPNPDTATAYCSKMNAVFEEVFTYLEGISDEKFQKMRKTPIVVIDRAPNLEGGLVYSVEARMPSVEHNGQLMAGYRIKMQKQDDAIKLEMIYLAKDGDNRKPAKTLTALVSEKSFVCTYVDAKFHTVCKCVVEVKSPESVIRGESLTRPVKTAELGSRQCTQDRAAKNNVTVDKSQHFDYCMKPLHDSIGFLSESFGMKKLNILPSGKELGLFRWKRSQPVSGR